MHYILELSKKQADIIKIALEEYSRLRMNQWWDFIERRDTSRMMFQEAMKVAQSGDRRPYTPATEEMLRAQDIWQVLRHQLYLDSGGSINDMVVDAKIPVSRTGEELPIMKRVEEI